MTSAHATAGAVSLVWLCPGCGPSSIRTFEALARATGSIAEALLVTPSPASASLEALPQRFARQSIVPADGPWTFANAANHGARHASASYLAFVDDTVVPDPGWLDRLLEAIAAPGVDAVTPRIVRRDGSLLAAGSIAWSDGAVEPLGGGEDPNLLEYSFRRVVPCAHFTGLLIRRAAFDAAGGFDGAYASATYAAADFCFSLGARRRNVAYQPRAIVRSVEDHGAPPPDSAADLEDGRHRFHTRWAEALSHYPAAPHEISERQLLGARDVLALERVLIVDDRVPGSDRGSGDPRMLKLLLEMMALWPSMRLTFVALRPIDAERYTVPLLDAGVEVVFGRDWTEWLESRRYHYGAVMVSRPQTIDELIRRTQPQAFRIYDAEALVYRRLERTLPFITEPERAAEVRTQLAMVRAIEVNYFAESDLILCVTEEECRVARAVAATVPAFVVPHWVPAVDSAPSFPERRDLVFFGGFMAGPGAPNEDALLHLAANVLPLILAQEPDIVLHVVGADPTPAVLALQSDHIHVVGYAADPTVWLHRARVHVVPMRFGSGVKLKLIDTMAAGLPFVTTAVGAEGLRLGSLRHVSIAESAGDLARLTIALYRERLLWTTTHQRVLSVARRYFGHARFRRSLVKAMSHVGMAPSASSGGAEHPL